jgi:type I restriction enzyme, S subunit
VNLSAEFKRFPSHWKVLPFLEAVKDSTSGNRKIPRSEYQENGDIPIVDQGQDLYGGYTNNGSLKVLVEPPVIVFGDHTRAFKYIEDEFCLGADGAKILEPKVELDKRFLYHYLKQLKIESAGYSRHFKFLKETFVPVPPLKEQKHIAAILDKADNLRRKRQQAIQLADEFLRAVFLDMFGDPVTNPKGFKKVPITQLAEVITGYAFKSSEYVKPDESSVRLCRGANTLTGYFDWSDTAYWSKDKLNGVENYLLIENDVILAMDRPWISSGLKVCIFSSYEEETYLVQRVARLRPISPKYSEYLYSCVKSKSFELHCKPTETTVPHISPIELKNFGVVFPEEKDIDKYYSIVIEIRKLLKKMSLSDDELDSSFYSLSQKAFAGKL